MHVVAVFWEHVVHFFEWKLILPCLGKKQRAWVVCTGCKDVKSTLFYLSGFLSDQSALPGHLVWEHWPIRVGKGKFKVRLKTAYYVADIITWEDILYFSCKA